MPTESPQALAPAPLEVPLVRPPVVPDGASVPGRPTVPPSPAPDSAEPSIPTMEEVLEAPSPRRAAREAAALGAAVRQDAPEQDAPEQDEPEQDAPEQHESDQHESVQDESVQRVLDQDEPDQDGPVQDALLESSTQESGTYVTATAESAPPQSASDAAPDEGAVAETEDSESATDEDATRAERRPSPSTGIPGAPSGLDSLSDEAGRSPAHPPASPTRAEVPASEWAESLRQASERAEAEAHEPVASVSALAPEGSVSRRPTGRAAMSTTQKGLFWVLASVIVIGLVLLIVLLTQQSGPAAGSESQSSSTSYGSESTSSITPLSISSGRNG